MLWSSLTEIRFEILDSKIIGVWEVVRLGELTVEGMEAMVMMALIPWKLRENGQRNIERMANVKDVILLHA